MKNIALLAIVTCSLTAACTVRNDRTVVQPTPTVTTAPVVYTDPVPGSATTTTVYTPAR